MAQQDKRLPWGRIAGACTLGVVGVLWAYLVALAGAMKTAPSTSVAEAFMAMPPSALALALAAQVIRDARGGRVPGRSALWVAPAVILGVLGLLIGVSTYFGQPGGWR